MNLELMHPLKTYNINFIIIPGGTATFSPLFYSKLKEANIKNVKAKKVEILPNNQAIFKLVTYSK